MGAEQIGYLVKGPEKIPDIHVVQAVRACRQRRAELLAAAGGEGDATAREHAALSVTGDYFDPADIPEDPKSAIREFIEWWHATDLGDTCCRSDPDQAGQRILFAGEMSSGDEPQGTGYQMLKRAYTWGFARALGIR